MGPGSYVPFSGPIPCPLMVVGEAPGKTEDRWGKPFCGKSGQVLWQFAFRHANLIPEEMRVGNLYPWRPVGGDQEEDEPPSEAQQAEGWELLQLEIRHADPDLILVVGAISTRWLLEDQSLKMEDVHGLLFTREILGKTRGVVPCLHPAAGLRPPHALLAHTAHDLAQFRAAMRGEVEVWEKGRVGVYRRATPLSLYPPHPGPGRYPRLAIDTEGERDSCLSLQFSWQEGEGWLIPAGDHALLTQLAWVIAHYRPVVVMQHAQHDLKVMRRMTPSIDLVKMGITILDTMFQSYELGGLDPLNLKGLARRHCGMEMRDYEEVVGPYLDKAREEWWRREAAAFERAFEYKPKVLKSGKPSKAKPERALATDTPENRPEWFAEADKKAQRVVKDLDAGKSVNLENRYNSLAETMGQKPGWGTVGVWPDLWQGLSYVPEPEMIEYAAKDPDATLRVHHRLSTRIEDEGLLAVSLLDHAVLPMIDRMEENGMLVDQDELRALEKETESQRAVFREMLLQVTGNPQFNPDSGDQVAEFLFSTLKLPILKLTKKKTRASTDDKVLELLRIAAGAARRTHHEAVVSLLQLYRETSKMVTAFLRPLWGFIGPDGRVHPRIKAATVVSGRFACEDPNLLAFPTRSIIGKRIRKLFKARPGWKMHSADLSQIELRWLAILSGDRNLIATFLRGEDIHIATARLMFPGSDDVGKGSWRREGAKTINYGILYGLSAMGLQEQYAKQEVERTLEECEADIARWFRAYPKVKEWMAEIWSKTRQRGYATTPLGRRRYLPAISLTGEGWPFAALRGEAERQAVNLMVQGAAAETIKRAMKRAWGFAYREDEAIPLLQIHDELLSEVRDDPGVMEDFDRRMLACLAADTWEMGTEIPIVAESHYGDSWGELK